jgi:hypothetical protein
MEYNLVIEKRYADPEYRNGLKVWKEVTSILRNELTQSVISVNIYKYSSDDRLLGKRHVTMANLWDVANSLTDKVLL